MIIFVESILIYTLKVYTLEYLQAETQSAKIASCLHIIMKYFALKGLTGVFLPTIL